MSAEHPIDRYIHLKAGDTFVATGTGDRHWPLKEHLVLHIAGKCTESDDSHLSFELSDESNGISGSGSCAFLAEGSERNTTSDDGNTLVATGKFGPRRRVVPAVVKSMLAD